MTYQIPFVIPSTGETTNQIFKKNLILIQNQLNDSTAGVVTLDTAQEIIGVKTFESSSLKLEEVSGEDSVTVAVAALGADRTYTVPDAGGAASFVMTAGTQTITGIKTMSALTLGADMDAGSFKIGSLAKGTSSGYAIVYEQVTRTLWNHNSDTASTHTDGTEDDLYSDTLSAGVLAANGDKIFSTEYLVFAASATAARRIKKYFGGTLIFDSGSLTLTLGADFSITTEIIRESSSIVRIVVRVTTTSASSVPYVTYTRITGLTLANTQILKSTGIASGTGAASGDITEKMGWVQWIPAT